MKKVFALSTVASLSVTAQAAPGMAPMSGMDMPAPNAPEPANPPTIQGQKPNNPMGHGTMGKPKMADAKMDHSMIGQDMMRATTNVADPMAREGSGTSWLPDSSPMYMVMKMRGRDTLMFHGNVYPRYTRIGGDRDVSGGGKGGRSRFDAPSMLMGMVSHPLDAGDKPRSQLGVRLMLSTDAFIERGYGYPLLFQSGESYKGEGLHDRQHPHDLFSELSVTYSRRLGATRSAYAYFGYPGEPALGPPAYVHRISGMDFPDAPLAHHWQDATHITFGVTTLGYSFGKIKVEGSAFNGREPDENRYNFDSPRLSSYAGRLSWNPTSNLALQVSNGLVKSPEALRPDENQRRTTASVIYDKPMGQDGNLATSFIYGQNNTTGEGLTRAFTLESALQKQKNTIFMRAEQVQKSGEELELAAADAGNIYGVNAFSVGYVRDLKHGNGVDVGLGVQATLSDGPSSLNFYYGSGPYTGFQIYFRIRPSKMKMDGMKMEGGKMDEMPMGKAP